ncbi:hypothetical protein CBM2606_A40376 [Cupriavidus taiwanensis]|nr:hypothetical protein CBM2606_A40376 [Cupriavidus taiwanensis]
MQRTIPHKPSRACVIGFVSEFSPSYVAITRQRRASSCPLLPFFRGSVWRQPAAPSPRSACR